MKRIFLLLVVVASITTGCSSAAPYAAIVNGQRISDSVVNEELQAVTSNPLYARELDQEIGAASGGLQPNGSNTVNSTYVAQVVYYRILVALIDQGIAKNHLTITPADTQAAEASVRSGFDNNEIFNSLPVKYRNYLISRGAALTVLTNSFATPAKEQAYYDANPGLFTTYCASHILVTSQTLAQSLHDQIAGGADFATLAKANSIDTSSGTQGGDLGCQPAGSYVAPFASALESMQPGQLSEPVQTQYGWHVIKVISVTKQSFNDAKATIAQTLASPTQYFTTALSQAKIKVNPRYGDFQPGDASKQTSPQVIPHTANALSPPTTAAFAADSGLSDQSGDQSGGSSDGSVAPSATDGADPSATDGSGGASTDPSGATDSTAVPAQ